MEETQHQLPLDNTQISDVYVHYWKLLHSDIFTDGPVSGTGAESDTRVQTAHIKTVGVELSAVDLKVRIE